MVQRQRDRRSFLIAAGVFGILTFAFAMPSRAGGVATVGAIRQALREAAGVGTVTILFMGSWRQQWRRTLVASLIGLALLCWFTFAPDHLIRPSGAVLLTLAYACSPVLIGFHVWRRVRR